MKNITRIEYPNTAQHDDFVQSWQSVSKTASNSCDELRLIQKESDMTYMVNWIQVIKNGIIIAEIKESVCNIYGADPVETEEISIPEFGPKEKS